MEENTTIDTGSDNSNDTLVAVAWIGIFCAITAAGFIAARKVTNYMMDKGIKKIEANKAESKK